MGILITTTPRITAYWTGYQRIDNESDQPFNPTSSSIPAYVAAIDVIPLAFCLVRSNTIQYNCDPHQTSLAMGPDRNGWTQPEIKDWVQRVKEQCPNTHFVLSIGGAIFNEWDSVTTADEFAANVITRLDLDWMGTVNGQPAQLISGLDIDYEGGGLPQAISYAEIVKALKSSLDDYDKLPAYYLSMPYYSGSPWNPSAAKLQDSITYSTTMGYGPGLGDYETLIGAGYRATKGFSWEQNDAKDVGSFLRDNKLASAMDWNLCVVSTIDGHVPADYINAFDENIPD